MKMLFYVIVVILLMSCDHSNNSTKEKTKSLDSLISKDSTLTKNDLTLLNISRYDQSLLDYDGQIVDKRIWQDLNGENIVLFTLLKNELFVYHYVVQSDEAKLIRKVYDFEEACDYDLTLEFIPNSISVTDTDRDNIGEISFAYQKGCISDVSPLGLKLLMLENGNKYIISGSTSIDVGETKIVGDKNIDPSFDNAPDSFLEHANTIWNGLAN